MGGACFVFADLNQKHKAQSQQTSHQHTTWQKSGQYVVVKSNVAYMWHPLYLRFKYQKFNGIFVLFLVSIYAFFQLCWSLYLICCKIVMWGMHVLATCCTRYNYTCKLRHSSRYDADEKNTL